ncbi:MAG: class I SAM-dependent methyltransferase [Epsilonproteobacteria bacterium]|nr:class I SAM-dependent methyltransferase [Campylobacterota bacterium]
MITNTNYQLLDSGHGRKLEQIGSTRIIRPDTNCVWQPRLPKHEWSKAHATYAKNNADKWAWQHKKGLPPDWHFQYEYKKISISCQLKASGSKNIGVFPEQMANWSWMIDAITQSKKDLSVLNLFGYTGAATLCAAAAGAQVCHVDASKPSISQARTNAQNSGLANAPIRWIIDDCATFVKRELKRGKRYDALIMDPPSFGRSHKGKIFEFEKHVLELLQLCTRLLVPQPHFVIFNGYSMGFSPTVLANVLTDFYPDVTLDVGELELAHASDKRMLPCSLYARFKG